MEVVGSIPIGSTILRQGFGWQAEEGVYNKMRGLRDSFHCPPVIDKTAVLRILNTMITMSSTKARANFGEFLDKGSREPIIVKRQNREVGAFVPMSDWEKLRKLRLQELDDAVMAVSEEAAANGLTEEILNQILTEANPS